MPPGAPDFLQSKTKCPSNGLQGPFPFLTLTPSLSHTTILPGHNGALAVSTLGPLHWLLHLPSVLFPYITLWLPPHSLKIFSHLRTIYFET